MIHLSHAQTLYHGIIKRIVVNNVWLMNIRASVFDINDIEVTRHYQIFQEMSVQYIKYVSLAKLKICQ